MNWFYAVNHLIKRHIIRDPTKPLPRNPGLIFEAEPMERKVVMLKVHALEAEGWVFDIDVEGWRYHTPDDQRAASA